MTARLPHDAARMAWWLSAWLRGDVSPDDVHDGVVGDDAAHDVLGLDGPESVPLLLALGRLRACGATSAGLALPAPGLLVGLGGPSGFNTAALEEGEAVVLENGGLGLVPHRAGAGVVWQVLPASRRQLVDLGEADRALRTALGETSSDLAALDVARWNPDVADELMNLRHAPAFTAPRGTPPRAVELAGRAVQALRIVELALVDDGAAMSSYEISARSGALRSLDAASRQGLVAACSPEAWPPD